MPLPRVLVVLLLACCAPGFAQAQGFSAFAAGPPQITSTSKSPATAVEPWRIIRQAPDASSTQDFGDYQIRKNSHRFVPQVSTLVPSVQPQEDTICYSIRSYVVARDNEESDLTHPTHYSTCQPASRYRVKSAESRSVSPDR